MARPDVAHDINFESVVAVVATDFFTNSFCHQATA